MIKKVKNKKPETAASLRGIMSQVQASINRSNDGAEVTMPVGLAQRVHKALSEYERNERIQTEPREEI